MVFVMLPLSFPPLPFFLALVMVVLPVALRLLVLGVPLLEEVEDDTIFRFRPFDIVSWLVFCDDTDQCRGAIRLQTPMPLAVNLLRPSI